VKHLMISMVKGRFAGISGTITTGAEPSVVASIDAATIDTREPKRDAHLRSADFFDVEKFPTLEFRSRRVETDRGDRFRLIGDLTLHGVTREIVLEVTGEGQAMDPWGGTRTAFSATTSLDRREFGLLWNQALEAGSVLVGNEVRITLEIQAVAQAF
jgi:polyisoprenoid-binding protein YceI